MILKKHLMYYEGRNIIGNWYIPFFGLIFPILLFYLIGFSITNNIASHSEKQYILTYLFIMCLQITPLSAMFIGHSSLFSIEIENKIPLRLELFDISQKEQIIHRFVILWFFTMICILLQISNGIFFSDVTKPTFIGFLAIILSMTILDFSLFLFAHGLGLYFGRFSSTYGCTMILYFFFLVMGNMMGGDISHLPAPLFFIGKTLPFYNFTKYFPDVWRGEIPNLAPYIQSMIFFTLLSIIVLLVGLRFGKHRRS